MKNLDLTYSLKFSDHDPDFKGENPKISWVKLLPLDETIQYGDTEITFSMEYLREIVSETTWLNQHFDEVANGSPYRMPVWRDHQRSHDRDGSVLEVKLADRDGFTGVWAKVERTKDTQLALDEGRLGYVSAGIAAKYKTQDGEEFGPIIREISLTSDPFLKSIGSIQDTYDVQLSNNTNTQDGVSLMTPEEKKKALDELQRILKSGPQVPEIVRELEELMKKVERLQKENAKELSTDDGEEVVEVEEADLSQPEEAPAEVVTLAHIEAVIAKAVQPLQDELKRLKKAPKRPLNLSERGSQGEPEQVQEFASYSDKIEHLMKLHKCSRTEAVDIELKS